MTDNWIILPVIFQLALAVLMIFFWYKSRIQQIISIVGSVFALLIAVLLFSKVWNSGILTMSAAGWKAPFGIVFVADIFASTMVLLTSIAGLAVSVFSVYTISKARKKFGYFPIFHFLIMGLMGAFLTGDIFNLYVWFEIIIIASFVIMTLGGERQQIEGAINYVTMNLLASAIFLTAIGVLYGLAGTLNMADLSLQVALIENRTLVNVTAILFFVGFGIKSAVFPLYFWLPSSYHTPPSAVAAIFSDLLTKVGIYALLRVFCLIFIPDEFMLNLITFVAILTMFTGALGALIQSNIRKLFSYLIICHIGFMVAGLGMFTELAITGAIFYLIHDIIVKTNIFMVGGLIFKIKGSFKMSELGGIYKAYPNISFMIALVLFSLVGIPPLSGFWPKLFLFEAGFIAHNYWMIAAILLASFITLFVIAKLWAEVFWKAKPERHELIDQFVYYSELKSFKKLTIILPILFLTAISLYIGFGAENIIILSKKIAHELMHPDAYIKAVLGADYINNL
jgi:multicomponent Na+:H+ antiporter subunit D